MASKSIGVVVSSKVSHSNGKETNGMIKSKAHQIDWFTDPKIINLLKFHKIPVIDDGLIPLCEIDFSEGSAEQTRIDVELKWEDVENYAISMSSPGACFPKILLGKLKKPFTDSKKVKKLYVPYSGRHRGQAAMRAGLTAIGATVVDELEGRMADLIPRLTNVQEAIHGQTMAERIAHAQHLADKHNFDLRQLSQVFGIPKKALDKVEKVNKLRLDMRSKGVDTKKVADEIILEARTIKNLDTKAQAIKVISDFGVRGDAAKDFIRQVKNAQADGSEKDVIESEERKLLIIHNGSDSVMKRHHRTEFYKILHKMERFLEDHNTKEKAQVELEEDQVQIRAHWNRIVEIMEDVLTTETDK